jgi:hypothetical protein
MGQFHTAKCQKTEVQQSWRRDMPSEMVSGTWSFALFWAIGIAASNFAARQWPELRREGGRLKKSKEEAAEAQAVAGPRKVGRGERI